MEQIDSHVEQCSSVRSAWTMESLPASRPYVATRDMKRVQQSAAAVAARDWRAVALELDHGPSRLAPEVATARLTNLR